MHQDGGLKKLWRLSTREQVLDIMKFMSIGYYTNGVLVSPKVPRKRFVSEASKEEKNIFRKRLRR